MYNYKSSVHFLVGIVLFLLIIIVVRSQIVLELVVSYWACETKLVTAVWRFTNLYMIIM